MSVARRNAAAEQRARADRHQARLDGHGHLLVKANLTEGAYAVTVTGFIDGSVTMTCSHPVALGLSGRPWVADDHHAACKHQARVAQRLTREGFLRRADTGWELSDRAREEAMADYQASHPAHADPFRGLV